MEYSTKIRGKLFKGRLVNHTYSWLKKKWFLFLRLQTILVIKTTIKDEHGSPFCQGLNSTSLLRYHVVEFA
jgi:hypothetical protein